LRYFTAGHYLILYRIVEDGVEIVRVVFSGRNIASLF
jgi:plasmid stabilization system protein ParE